MERFKGLDFYELKNLPTRANIEEIKNDYHKITPITYPEKDGEGNVEKLLEMAYKHPHHYQLWNSGETYKDHETVDETIKRFQEETKDSKFRKYVQEVESNLEGKDLSTENFDEETINAMKEILEKHSAFKKRENNVYDPPIDGVFYCGICSEFFSSESSHQKHLVNEDQASMDKAFQEVFESEGKLPTINLLDLNEEASFWNNDEWTDISGAETVLEQIDAVLEDKVCWPVQSLKEYIVDEMDAKDLRRLDYEEFVDFCIKLIQKNSNPEPNRTTKMMGVFAKITQIHGEGKSPLEWIQLKLENIQYFLQWLEDNLNDPTRFEITYWIYASVATLVSGEDLEGFVMKIAVPSLTIIHCKMNRLDPGEVLKVCFHTIDYLLREKMVKPLLRIGTFLRNKHSRQFVKEIAISFCYKRPDFAVLFTKLIGVFWDEDDFREAVVSICNHLTWELPSPSLASLGCFAPSQVADTLCQKGLHENAIQYYRLLGDEAPALLLKRGKTQLKFGERGEALLYFSQAFEAIGSKSFKAKATLAIKIAILLFGAGDNLSKMIMDLFTKLSSNPPPNQTFKEELERMDSSFMSSSDCWGEISKGMESQILQNYHQFPEQWAESEKIAFCKDFSPIVSEEVKAALDNEDLQALGKVLVKVNSRNGIGLRALMAPRGKNVELLPKLSQILHYLVCGVIHKIEGNLKMALFAWENSLLFSCPLLVGEVSQIVANLIDFDTHFRLVQEVYSEIEQMVEKGVRSRQHFVGILQKKEHDAKTILNLKDFPSLVETCRVELAIPELTATFDRAIWYLHHSASVTDSITMISATLLGAAKLVLSLEKTEATPVRKWALKQLIGLSLQIGQNRYRRIGTPFTEGIFASWIANIFLRVGGISLDKDPDIIRELLLSKLSAAIVNPFTTISSFGIANILETLLTSSVQVEFQEKFFRKKLLVEGETGSLIPHYVFEYHLQDAIWREWLPMSAKVGAKYSRNEETGVTLSAGSGDGVF